jgi:hypothetical protein
MLREGTARDRLARRSGGWMARRGLTAVDQLRGCSPFRQIRGVDMRARGLRQRAAGGQRQRPLSVVSDEARATVHLQLG